MPGWFDFLKFFIAYVVLCGPFAIFGQTVLFWFFTGVYLFFVSFEFISSSVLGDGKSLSDRFWEFKKNHPKSALICAGGMILFWSYIICHFMLGW